MFSIDLSILLLFSRFLRKIVEIVFLKLIK